MPNSVRLAKFLPSKRMSPEITRPFSGRSFKIERAAVVLPQPDSPANPRLSPFSKVNETPSTALTQPVESLKWVCRSRTSKRPGCSMRSGACLFAPLVGAGAARVDRRAHDSPFCPVSRGMAGARTPLPERNVRALSQHSSLIGEAVGATLLTLAQLGIEHLVEGGPDEREGEHDQHDGHAGRQQVPPGRQAGARPAARHCAASCPS